MDRRPRREREEPTNAGLGWLWAGIAVVGVASVAAVAIAAAYGASRDKDEEKQKSSSSSSYQPRPKEDVPELTITVDATPFRGGGIIRFAGDNKTYFYSVDWTNTFSFPQESDKFEMVNALVALEIVKQFYHKRYQRILLQTDSNIALKLKRLESEKLHNQLLSVIKEMMASLLSDHSESNGKITHVSKESCIDMKLADSLSRNNWNAFDISLKLLSKPDCKVDVSSQASHVLSHVKSRVPTQFWQWNMEF